MGLLYQGFELESGEFYVVPLSSMWFVVQWDVPAVDVEVVEKVVVEFDH